MSFTIRTAALTQKASGCTFNGDSLNMNGRVLSVESADAGFRGAGKMASPFVLALASSDCNGVASAALTALNDRIPSLKSDCDNFPVILSDYFADSSYALEKSGNAPDSLAISVLFGYADNLIAARMGDVRIYRWSADALLEVGFVPEEEGEAMPESSCELIEDVYDGDFYVLCTEGVWGTLTETEIIAKLRAAGDDEKQIVRLLASACVSKAKDKNVSVFVARIVSDVVAPVAEDDSDMRIVEVAPSSAPVEVPVETPVAPVAEEEEEAVVEEESNVYIPENEADAYEDEEEYLEEEEEEAAPPSKAKKALIVVLMILGLLVGMAAVTFGAYKIAFSALHGNDVPAGLVGVGSQAQYDLEQQPTTVAPTEAATEEATTKEAATEEATTEEATTEDYYSYYEEYYYTTEYEEEEVVTEAPTTSTSYYPPETTEAVEDTDPVEDTSYWEDAEEEIPMQPDNPEGDLPTEGFPAGE